MKKQAKKATPIDRPAGDRLSLEEFTEMRARESAEWSSRLSLKDLDDRERAYLAVCQSVYRNDRGSGTPFEEFFTGLVTRVETGLVPTPESITTHIQEFSENFKSMEGDVRLFIQNYPEIAAKLSNADTAEASTRAA